MTSRTFRIIKFSGNGTQSIVWQINEETYRQTLEAEGGTPTSQMGPKIYYGSIHDILSYPCEVSSFAVNAYLSHRLTSGWSRMAK